MGNYHRVTSSPGTENSPELQAEIMKRAQPFTSREEIFAAMATDDYRNDEGCRDFVKRCLELTPAHIALGHATPSQEISADVLEARIAAVQADFADPRYKTSALFRYEAAQRLAKLTAGDGPVDTSGRGLRVEYSTDPNRAADVTPRLGTMRVEADFEETPAIKPASSKQ